MSDNQQNTQPVNESDFSQNVSHAAQGSPLLDDLPQNPKSNLPYSYTQNIPPYVNMPNNAPYTGMPNNPPYMNMQSNAPYMGMPNNPPYMNMPNNAPMPEKQKIKGEHYGEEEHYDTPKVAEMKHSAAYLCVIYIILAAFVMGIFALGYFGVIKPDGAISHTTLVERPSDDEKYTVEEIGRYVRPAIVEVNCFIKDESGEMQAYSSGSGVIISADGYIVTNQHVISVADKISVNVYEDSVSEEYSSYTAKVIGYDVKTDLAVIKIETDAELCVAVFGNADDCVLGEQVVAIGNPSGYAGTMTTGIVSGLNRSVRTAYTGYYMTCIQTDAPISPGNSGGALVNMYGQVIGITSSKIADTTVEGIGFAITMNEAKPIIDDILNYGYVRGRYRIGIKFHAEFCDEVYDIKGVYIAEIDEDSDVRNTELAVGDIITEINGVKIFNYDDIVSALEGAVAGDKVKAKVVRINEDTSVEEFEIEFKLLEDTSGDY